MDDSNLLNYPEDVLFQPETSLKDDYFIFSEGVERYFSPAWERMTTEWHTTSFTQKHFTLYRAGIVSDRLKRSILEKKKVLFICDYQLWWSVRQILAKGEIDREHFLPPKWEDRDAALLIENPYQLWSTGLLDDFPFVNLKFFQSLQEGRVDSFDKTKVLNQVLKDVTSGGPTVDAGNRSIRRFITFTRYLKTRMVSHQRVTPPPVLLFESAFSCVGDSFAKELAGRLLEYPFPEVLRLKDIPPIFYRITPEGVILLGQVFDIPDILRTTSYYGSSSSFGKSPWEEETEKGRRRWADLVHPHITRQERAEMGGKDSGMRWAIQEDYALHRLACDRILDLVRRKSDLLKVERSWGTMRDGIHWKATLSAFARGEEAIYVKRKINRRLHYKKLDEYTPVVFLFSTDMKGSNASTVHDSNASLRNIELGNKDFPFERYSRPDMVYSVFLTSNSTENLWDTHIQREQLTSISFLYNRPLMGTERYEALNRRSSRFQCRLTPMEDPDLRDFPLSEMGVAWGIKYAEAVVIVVRYPGWKPSERLVEFAKLRNVEILSVSLSALPPSLAERLQHMYFTSTPMKKHPERERIVTRFLN
jgi:hypothetical protein